MGGGVGAALETGAHTPDPQLPPMPSPPNEPLLLDGMFTAEAWFGNPGANAFAEKPSPGPGPGPIGLELTGVAKGSGEGMLELGLDAFVRLAANGSQ